MGLQSGSRMPTTRAKNLTLETHFERAQDALNSIQREFLDASALIGDATFRELRSARSKVTELEKLRPKIASWTGSFFRLSPQLHNFSPKSQSLNTASTSGPRNQTRDQKPRAGRADHGNTDKPL